MGSLEEPVLTSKDFEWQEQKETFRLLYHEWDVDAAKRLIIAAPRPVYQIAVSALEDMVGWVDTEGSTPVALDHPVIVATLGEGEHIVIDGWRRVARAMNDDLAFLLGVFLDEEETKKVTLR